MRLFSLSNILEYSAPKKGKRGKVTLYTTVVELEYPRLTILSNSRQGKIPKLAFGDFLHYETPFSTLHRTSKNSRKLFSPLLWWKTSMVHYPYCRTRCKRKSKKTFYAPLYPIKHPRVLCPRYGKLSQVHLYTTVVEF